MCATRALASFEVFSGRKIPADFLPHLRQRSLLAGATGCSRHLDRHAGRQWRRQSVAEGRLQHSTLVRRGRHLARKVAERTPRSTRQRGPVFHKNLPAATRVMVVALSSSDAVVRLCDNCPRFGNGCTAPAFTIDIHCGSICTSIVGALWWRALLASTQMVPFHRGRGLCRRALRRREREQSKAAGAMGRRRKPLATRPRSVAAQVGAALRHLSQVLTAHAWLPPSWCGRRRDAASTRSCPHKLLELDDNVLHGVVYSFLDAICWTARGENGSRKFALCIAARAPRAKIRARQIEPPAGGGLARPSTA